MQWLSAVTHYTFNESLLPGKHVAFMDSADDYCDITTDKEWEV